MSEPWIDAASAAVSAALTCGGIVWKVLQSLPSKKDLDSLETRVKADACAMEARMVDRFVSKDTIQHIEKKLDDIHDEVKYLRQRLDQKAAKE